MIRLIDVLDGLSVRSLTDLCRQHGIQATAAAPGHMQGLLAAKLGDPVYLRRYLESLREPLRLLLLGVAVQRTAAMTQGALSRLVREPVDQLVKEAQALGLLSPGYDVPVEAVRALGQIWAQTLTQPLAPGDKPAAADPTGPGVLRNLVVMLGMGARWELLLTQQNEFFKKTVTELTRRCEAGNRPSADPLANLLASYATDRGLLVYAEYDGATARGSHGLMTAPLAETWLQHPWTAIWTDLAQYTLDQMQDYFPPLRLVLHTLLALPEDGWILIQAWGREFDRLVGTEYAWMVPTSEALTKSLLMLNDIDLVSLAVSPESEMLIRPSPALIALMHGQAPNLPAPDDRFFLQPNFELLVPKTVPPAVLYRLEQLAGDRRADQVIQFTISPASLRAALEAGENPETILSFFQQHSKTPVPPNVLTALQEWTGGAARARFEQVTLLRVGDPATAGQLKIDRKLAGLILGQLTPVDLIVDPAGVEKVRRRLAELAVVTAPGIGKPGSQSLSALPASKRAPRQKPLRLATPAEFTEQWLGTPPGSGTAQAEAAATHDLPHQR